MSKDKIYFLVDKKMVYYIGVMRDSYERYRYR